LTLLQTHAHGSQVASFGVETLGLNYSSSTTLIIILNAVGIPARIVPPYFADKIGQFNILVPALACITIVSYCWLVVNTVGGLYVFTVLFGLLSASFQGLVPSTVASVTPELDMVGTRLGMAFSTLSFAALTGPPIGGALQNAMGGRYLGAQLFAATALVTCVVLFTTARVSKGGWKLKVRC